MKFKNCPIELLQDYFEYSTETGQVTWIKSPQNHNKVGKIVGAYNKGDNYFYVNFFSEKYPLHRVIWALHYGEWPKLFIDHIDRDRTNNSLTNLRLATKADNCRNRTSKKGSSSQYVGVTYKAKSGKWLAQININNKRTHLGSFKTELEAVNKYNEVANLCYGDFASTNNKGTTDVKRT